MYVHYCTVEPPQMRTLLGPRKGVLISGGEVVILHWDIFSLEARPPFTYNRGLRHNDVIVDDVRERGDTEWVCVCFLVYKGIPIRTMLNRLYWCTPQLVGSGLC